MTATGESVPDDAVDGGDTPDRELGRVQRIAGRVRARPAIAHRRLPDQTGLVLSLVVACTVLTFASPYFLTADNQLNISRAVAYWAVSAAAATIVIVGGMLDLSIGAVMALVGVTCGLMLQSGDPWWLAMIVGLMIGAAVGAVNGTAVAYIGVNPFIITIAAAFIVRGIAYLVADGQQFSITASEFTELGQGDIAGIPVPLLIMLAVFALIYYVMRFTRFGKHVYAVGGASEASRLVGIPVARRRFQILVVSGLLAAVSGIMLAGYTGGGLATAGQGIELTVITAVILGGTSLFGGRGSVVGTLIGVALLGVINNGVTLLGVQQYWQLVVQGVALALAVVIDQVRTNRASR